MNHDAAEAEAMRWFYAQPASPNPWQPGTPDRTAEGMLASAKAAREARK